MAWRLTLELRRRGGGEGSFLGTTPREKLCESRELGALLGSHAFLVKGQVDHIHWRSVLKTG